MSELTDRLMTLAARGTPRGFDAVLDAAKQATSFEVVDGGSDDDGPGVALPDRDSVPFGTLEPVERRPRRRPLTSMIAAAGLAAMLVVGLLAVSAVMGGGGGAARPRPRYESLPTRSSTRIRSRPPTCSRRARSAS